MSYSSFSSGRPHETFRNVFLRGKRIYRKQEPVFSAEVVYESEIEFFITQENKDV